MKKTILVIFAIISFAQSSLAFDLEKAIGAVDSMASNKKNPASKSINSSITAPLERLEEKATQKIDNVMNKVENKIDKATSKIEQRVEKYEEKFDKYEKKIEKLEKTTDKVIDTFNSFDAKKLDKLAQIAKYIAIGVGAFFALLISLLILVLIQLTRVNKKLSMQA